jgi:hypothetical protein
LVLELIQSRLKSLNLNTERMKLSLVGVDSNGAPTRLRSPVHLFCQASRADVRLCSRMVCTRCGMIGADVRPDWGPHVNKRHV